MDFNSILIMWVIVSVICLVLDLLTSTFLFVWFTMGGIAAIITMTFGGNFQMQIIVFAVVTALSYAVGYPIAKKYLRRDIPKTLTMEEKYIGRVITAEKPIETEANIKLEGIYWTVKNEGDPIETGEKFTIKRIEGNKLIIKK